MIFNSLTYLIFLPVVLILLGLTPVKYRWIVLLGASYWFYMSWNPKLVVLILLATGISYLTSQIIERSESKKVKNTALIFALVSMFGMLFFFKYFNFFIESTAALLSVFGMKADYVTLNIVLPVGISFYTFQTLSYVIDVYRKTVKAENNFFMYALFVSFFPQLVAGPIERPDKLLPQLKADIRFKKENVVPGLSRMIIGYFKKTAVADTIAVYVESVYQNPDGQNGLSVLIATLLFSVQIYCDFSGYSDIAVGTSRLMGIRLMENFTQPYFSDSIRTFWDRWHRSLSEWLKDYLYFPLGGSRCSKLKTQRNILIVFLASGLWHGANFTFIIWGALHGIARVIENLVYPQRKKMEEKMNPAVRIIWGGICRVLTFLYVSFAWIFFRADSVSDAMTMTGKLFTDFSVTSKTLSAAIELLQLTPASTILAVGLIALLFLYDLGVRRHREEDILLDGSVEEGTISLRLITLFWIVIAAALMQIAAGGASTFLYFQF